MFFFSIMSHKVPVVQWFILLKTKATQANRLLIFFLFFFFFLPWSYGAVIFQTNFPHINSAWKHTTGLDLNLCVNFHKNYNTAKTRASFIGRQASCFLHAFTAKMKLKKMTYKIFFLQQFNHWHGVFFWKDNHLYLISFLNSETSQVFNHSLQRKTKMSTLCIVSTVFDRSTRSVNYAEPVLPQ